VAAGCAEADTLLSASLGVCESGVALRLPPQSMTRKGSRSCLALSCGGWIVVLWDYGQGFEARNAIMRNYWGRPWFLGLEHAEPCSALRAGLAGGQGGGNACSYSSKGLLFNSANRWIQHRRP